MRKLLLAVVCLMFITGLAVAADVVVVKLDGKNLTVKEGDKEKTYKLTDKTKVSIVGKDGTATEGKMETLEKRLSGDKGPGTKLDITTSGDEITEIKMKGGKKK